MVVDGAGPTTNGNQLTLLLTAHQRGGVAAVVIVAAPRRGVGSGTAGEVKSGQVMDGMGSIRRRARLLHVSKKIKIAMALSSAALASSAKLLMMMTVKPVAKHACL